MSQASVALRRDSFTPLYVQLRDRIVASVDAGELRPGDRLPSEPELAERYGVGRPTVREALGLLRSEGRITTRRGAGTFVTEPAGRVSLLGFEGLTQAVTARGVVLHDEVLGGDIVEVPPLGSLVPDALGVEALEDSSPQHTDGGAWWAVRRLRSMRVKRTMQPCCLEVDAFALSLCPDAAALFARHGSAAAVLEEIHGFSLARCDVATGAVSATRRQARQLDVPPGAPLLAMERVNRIDDGRAVHVATFLIDTARLPVVEHLVNPVGRSR